MLSKIKPIIKRNFPAIYDFKMQLIAVILFYKFYGLKFFGITGVNNYIFGIPFIKLVDEVHLKAAIRWLCEAQNRCSDTGGVSRRFSLKDGWEIAYPETSGYIIPTLTAYAKFSGDSTYIERAIELADWEVKIQAPSGGVYSTEELRKTVVFNTGQVILGLCDIYNHTKDSKYLKSAMLAGDYMIEAQDDDGAWRRDIFDSYPSTYQARSDWGLLRLSNISDLKKYEDAAIKNIEWIAQRASSTGWFEDCGFFSKEKPITHVIGYTLQGLMESLLLTQNSRLINLNLIHVLSRSANNVCSALKNNKFNGADGLLPTTLDKNWLSSDGDSCLTGNVQIACFLYKLGAITNNKEYKFYADKIVDATKSMQQVGAELAEINGALPGSFPFYKGYCANSFPNWATKFLADALMMKLSDAKIDIAG